jgi:hypothetical protein
MSTVMQDPKTIRSGSAAVPALDTLKRFTLEHTREQMRLADLEAQAARLCMAPMNDLARCHPEWMAQFDDVEPDIADLADLVMLLETAPSPFAQGLVYGKLTLRSQALAMGAGH